jgi:hypothetical protein
MPLGRFPLVSLLRLSDGLKALTERSQVVSRYLISRIFHNGAPPPGSMHN